MPRFKVGDIVAVHKGCELVMLHGWEDTMVLRIKVLTGNAYIYEHLTKGSRLWPRGSSSIWSYEVIDNNFEIDKAGTILYGKI